MHSIIAEWVDTVYFADIASTSAVIGAFVGNLILAARNVDIDSHVAVGKETVKQTASHDAQSPRLPLPVTTAFDWRAVTKSWPAPWVLFGCVVPFLTSLWTVWHWLMVDGATELGFAWYAGGIVQTVVWLALIRPILQRSLDTRAQLPRWLLYGMTVLISMALVPAQLLTSIAVHDENISDMAATAVELGSILIQFEIHWIWFRWALPSSKLDWLPDWVGKALLLVVSLATRLLADLVSLVLLVHPSMPLESYSVYRFMAAVGFTLILNFLPLLWRAL